MFEQTRCKLLVYFSIVEGCTAARAAVAVVAVDVAAWTREGGGGYDHRASWTFGD